MYFSAARRAEVKEADPSLSFGDIAKRIAELWKAATPDEKAPFEADAAQDKVRCLCADDAAPVLPSHHDRGRRAFLQTSSRQAGFSPPSLVSA